MQLIDLYTLPPIWLLVGICWLLALIGVTHDVCLSRRWRSSWWVPLTLLLGPFAAAIYLLTWTLLERPRPKPARQMQAAERGAGRTRIFGGRRNDASPPTIPMGSGLFVLVRAGAMQDAYRSSAIPPDGLLVVRRASNADDRARPGELLLHDRAVSRQQHCVLRRSGGTIFLDDTSTNGTFVDQQQILHTSAPVPVGSTIHIGTTELLLCDERQVFPTQRRTIDH